MPSFSSRWAVVASIDDDSQRETLVVSHKDEGSPPLFFPGFTSIVLLMMNSRVQVSALPWDQEWEFDFSINEQANRAVPFQEPSFDPYLPGYGSNATRSTKNGNISETS